MARTPFKLRSASPFKKDKMVHNEGGENVLKNVSVNKGETSIYTYKKMHADLLKKGMSQADADKQVQKAKVENIEKYGTHNPTKEGLANNTRTTEGSMDMEDISKPGTEGKQGHMMNSFNPTETRRTNREFKINDNRFNRRENKDRKYNNRYEKGLGFDPSTLTDEFKESNPDEYNELSLKKQAYDKSRKGEKQLMKISQNKREMDFYDTRTKNSEMGAQQGANSFDGTMIEYDPDGVGPDKKTASTEGSDKTILTDEQAKGYKNTADVDLGSNTTDESYTDSLSGGDGGSTTTTTEDSTDTNVETTETDNSSLMQGAKDMLNKARANAHAVALGPMGQLLNVDGDGDGDTILNDKNNDGTMLSRFMNKITSAVDPGKEALKTNYGRDKSAAPFKLKKHK